MAIIVLISTLPIPIASESHWIRQDRLYLQNSPNCYEHKIAMQARKELRERLEMGN